MAKAFDTVGLISKPNDTDSTQTLAALAAFLVQRGVTVIIEQNSSINLDINTAFSTASLADIGARVALLIVVGGDGSLLRASHTAIIDDLPMLGINRGRLGFLTDICPSELDKIGAIVTGDYLIEERFLLDATVNANSRTESDVALNDVVIMRNKAVYMIEFEIYVDNIFVCNQKADGLIISTPTGSTAYALSAGGPILHPSLNAITLVPMFPHTLSNRPLVINGDCEISILLITNNQVKPHVSCDGQPGLAVELGSHVTIRKKEKKLRLVHPLDYNYYQTLRTKLGWG